MKSNSSRQAGFTTIELLVTILVTASLVATISQLLGFIGNLAVTAQNDEIASNVAYNNMRLYASGQQAKLWFVCNGDDASDTNTTIPFSDANKYPSTTGQQLINTTYTNAYNNLPPPVVVTVMATAPYGCGNDVQSGLAVPSNMPIRVISTVTYGSPSRKVVHATYVPY